MKTPYDFDAHRPPVVTKQSLEDRLEARRQRRYALLLTLAALVTQALLLALGVTLVPMAPGLALVCLAYVCLTVTAGGVLALFTVKRGRFVA